VDEFREQNYFLSHFPSLLPVLLHPSFRLVSGIGVLDIFGFWFDPSAT
jgi:hypothetical protein